VQLLTLRAESGLLRTRLEGQEKEIAQLRKQIKHLEEKERVANESVIFYSSLECYKYNMYL
jgi:cell division protein FtsL